MMTPPLLVPLSERARVKFGVTHPKEACVFLYDSPEVVLSTIPEDWTLYQVDFVLNLESIKVCKVQSLH